MTDDQIRALVRDAIARHMAGAEPSPVMALPPPARPAQAFPAWAPAGLAVPASSQGQAQAPVAVIASAPGGLAIAVGPGATVQLHVSHAAFALPPACDGGHDGPCAIEPDAACNQCGFCQSFGH